MRRRELLWSLGTVPFWSRRVRAQSILPIGLLHSGSANATQPEISALREGVEQTGRLENRNIVIEARWAERRYKLLPTLALDLVRSGVAVIVAAGNKMAIIAAKEVAKTIPVVFISSFDPIDNTTSGAPNNITGVTLASTDLMAKRFELLHQLAPRFTTIGALVNPENRNITGQLQYLDDSVKRIGISVQIMNVSNEREFESAVDQIAQHRDRGLVVANDAFLNGKQDKLIALTGRNRIPAAFGTREFVEAGGLMSYGPSLIEAYRQAGVYVGDILQGQDPSQMPIQHPLQFELAINRKTAKTLGLEPPPALLAVAEQVLE
jgi:putative tryptophan/tyrosine transport system substrate-binding protein